MNNEEKYKIAFRFTAGTSSGLSFLEDYLYDKKNTDIAYIRSIYILLSYHVELLLKSRVVMTGSFSDKDKLKAKLTKLSHDLTKIGQELNKVELSKIGIKNITKNGTKFIIETVNNIKIKTEDFTDIRYDYLFGKMRTISDNEYKEIKDYIEELFKILNLIEKYNEEDKDCKNNK